MVKKRDWDHIILNVLNARKDGTLKIRMGTPNAAQVTRCRLLETYNGIKAKTHGRAIIIERLSA